MTIYMVHLPTGAKRGSAEGLERAELVKDGFHWLALIFPLIWLLVARAWLAAVLFVVLAMAIGIGGPVLGLREPVIAGLEVLLSVCTAVFAGDIKSWALSRRGMPVVDVVSASSREEAERRFFARWLAGTSGVTPRPAAAPPPGPQVSVPGHAPVLGLFPQPGGRA